MMTVLVLGLAFAGISAMFVSLYRDPESVSRRALRKAGTTRIRDFADSSYGKVIGQVKARGTTLETPLTGRRCVYYRSSVELKALGKDGHGFHWSQLWADESAQNFVLDDDGDRALVLLDGARVQLAARDEYQVGTLGEFPEDVQHTLLELPQVAGHAAMGHTLRYVERALEPGTQVAVMAYGVFQTDLDPSAAPADYRGVATQLVLQGRKGQPLVLSDEPSAVGGPPRQLTTSLPE